MLNIFIKRNSALRIHILNLEHLLPLLCLQPLYFSFKAKFRFTLPKPSAKSAEKRSTWRQEITARQPTKPSGHHVRVRACLVYAPRRPVGISSSRGPQLSSGPPRPCYFPAFLCLHAAGGSDWNPCGHLYPKSDHFSPPTPTALLWAILTAPFRSSDSNLWAPPLAKVKVIQLFRSCYPFAQNLLELQPPSERSQCFAVAWVQYPTSFAPSSLIPSLPLTQLQPQWLSSCTSNIGTLFQKTIPQIAV